MSGVKMYVYSKMSAGVEYVDWISNDSNDLPKRGESVIINGGAGVANKNLITPLGVRTEITSDQAELLNRNRIFNLHKANGFVTIEKAKVDVETVVADMAGGDDPSAPLTPADFQNAPGTVAKPVGTKSAKK